MSATAVVRSHPDGALMNVWVVPGARRTEIVGLHGDALRLRVVEAAERGRANKAVLALLEETFRARFRLAGGAGSRRKRVIAVGVTPKQLQRQVAELAN